MGLPQRFLLPRVLNLQNQFLSPFFLIGDKFDGILRVLCPRIFAPLHEFFVELLQIAFGWIASLRFGRVVIMLISAPWRSGSVSFKIEIWLFFDGTVLWLSLLL
jgi:hypothetical protein